MLLLVSDEMITSHLFVTDLARNFLVSSHCSSTNVDDKLMFMTYTTDYLNYTGSEACTHFEVITKMHPTGVQSTPHQPGSLSYFMF